MKTTLSKKSENKLKCICGMCKHTYENKNCAYNSIVDSENPEEKMFKEIIKIFKEENKNVDRQPKRKSKSK